MSLFEVYYEKEIEGKKIIMIAEIEAVNATIAALICQARVKRNKAINLLPVIIKVINITLDIDDDSY